MSELERQAAAEVRRRWSRSPAVAIVLGTGLGSLAAEIEVEAELPYDAIPHFPATTALGHAGRLVCGQLNGVPVAAMNGRCHFYEGYSLEQLSFPIRVLAALGAARLIVSNASGGLHPHFRQGDLMLIDGHIDLMGRRMGVSPSPCLSSPYDRPLCERASATARRHDILLHRGVYVGVLGPNYETRAEYRALRRLGGDAVGMSTIPELHAAAACGLRAVAISTITNVAVPDAPTVNDGNHVLDAAQAAQPRLRRIVLELLRD